MNTTALNIVAVPTSGSLPTNWALDQTYEQGAIESFVFSNPNPGQLQGAGSFNFFVSQKSGFPILAPSQSPTPVSSPRACREWGEASLDRKVFSPVRGEGEESVGA